MASLLQTLPSPLLQPVPAITEHHKLGAYQRLLLTVPEAKSKVQVLAAVVSDEGLVPGSQMAISSLDPHMVEKTRKLLEVTFIKTLIPLTRAEPAKGPAFKPPPLEDQV